VYKERLFPQDKHIHWLNQQMSHKLAVEWRPLYFDEVLGQSSRNNPEEKNTLMMASIGKETSTDSLEKPETMMALEVFTQAIE
jgi:hypothetical protein